MSKAFFCDNCKVLKEGAPRLSFFNQERTPPSTWEGTATWRRCLSWREFSLTLTIRGGNGEEWCTACTDKALFAAIEELVADGRLSGPVTEAKP